MADEVFEIGFKVDTSGVEGDADAAGKLAKAGFERGFGVVEVKPKVSPEESAKSGETYAKTFHEAAAKVHRDERGRFVAAGIEASAKAGEAHAKAYQEGAGRAKAGEGLATAAIGAAAVGKAAEEAEKGIGKLGERLEKVGAVGIRGMGTLRTAIAGISETMATGSFAVAATKLGEFTESAAKTGEAAGGIGAAAATAAPYVTALLATVAGGAYATKELSDRGSDLVLTIDGISKSSALGVGPILGMSKAATEQGIHIEDLARGLGRLNLAQLRATREIEKRAIEEPLDVLDAQRRVTQAYRAREAAIDGVGAAEDRVTKARAAVAAQQVGGLEEQRIAAARGPLSVEAAGIGVAEAQIGATQAAYALRAFKGQPPTEAEQERLQLAQLETQAQAADLRERQAELTERQARVNERERQATLAAEGGPAGAARLNLNETLRNLNETLRAQQEAREEPAAAQRGITRAEGALAILPQQQITGVAEMVRARDPGLSGVSPELLFPAMQLLGRERGGGIRGTIGAIQDFLKDIRDLPEESETRQRLQSAASGMIQQVFGARTLEQAQNWQRILTSPNLQEALGHRPTAEEVRQYGPQAIETALIGRRAEAETAETINVAALKELPTTMAATVKAFDLLNRSITPFAEAVGGTLRFLGLGPKEGAAPPEGEAAPAKEEAPKAEEAPRAEEAPKAAPAAKPEEAAPAPEVAPPQPRTTRTITVESSGVSHQVEVQSGDVASQAEVKAAAAPPVRPADGAGASAAGALTGAAGALSGAAGALSGAAGALSGAAGALSAGGAARLSASSGGGGGGGGEVQAVEQARGGLISGPGDETSDSIPAMLSRGEYVLRASAVRRLGTPFLDRLNARGFASGGLVERATAAGVTLSRAQMEAMSDEDLQTEINRASVVSVPLAVAGALAHGTMEDVRLLNRGLQAVGSGMITGAVFAARLAKRGWQDWLAQTLREAPHEFGGGRIRAQPPAPQRTGPVPTDTGIRAALDAAYRRSRQGPEREEPTFPPGPASVPRPAMARVTVQGLDSRSSRTLSVPHFGKEQEDWEKEHHFTYLGGPHIDLTKPKHYDYPEIDLTHRERREAPPRERPIPPPTKFETPFESLPRVSMRTQGDERFPDLVGSGGTRRSERRRRRGDEDQSERLYATGGPVREDLAERARIAREDQGYAFGGLVPARVSNGEYLISGGAVAHYGVDFMDRLNEGRFQLGGPVGSREGYFPPSFGAYGAKMQSEGAEAAAQVWSAAQVGAGYSSQFSFGNAGLTASSMPPGVPSQGGMAGSHSLDLVTAGGTFTVMASEGTIGAIQSSAIGSRLTSTGTRPSWY